MIVQIARNVLAGFLLTLGITPSEGEDTLEIQHFGPHHIFTQQARVPDSMADTIIAAEVYSQLAAYIESHNSVPTAIKFQPYGIKTYVCPCGCGTFVYVSIYYDT